MKKMQRFLLSALAVTVALSSCNSDDKLPEGAFGDSPVRFTSDIFKRDAAVRSEKTDWGEDIIGVYAIKSGTSLGSALKENAKYTTTGDGAFAAASYGEAIRFPSNGDNLNFIAYYPYQATITDLKVPVDISDQSDEGKIDLLYSNQGVNYNHAATQVNLHFDHMLSRLVMNIEDESGLGLTGMEVKINGLPTKSAFSLENASFTNDDASAATMTANISTTGTDVQATALLLPAAGTAGAEVVFSFPDGRSYTWDISGEAFASKNQYTYKVNLKEDGVIMVVQQSTINGWTDNDRGNVDLNPDGDDGGDDGDVYEAGTLATWNFTAVPTIPILQTGASVLIPTANINLVGWATPPALSYTGSNVSIYCNSWDTNTTDKYWLFTLPLAKEIEAGMKVDINYRAWTTATGPKNWACEVSTDNSSWQSVATYELTTNYQNPAYEFTYTAAADIATSSLYIRLRPTDNVAIDHSSGVVQSGGNVRLADVSLNLAD